MDAESGHFIVDGWQLTPSSRPHKSRGCWDIISVKMLSASAARCEREGLPLVGWPDGCTAGGGYRGSAR